MNERPSVYLLRKAEALYEALHFFDNSNDHRIRFLAQIEFWEWEVENLIYSFESFEERSAIWCRPDAILRSLAAHGVSARSKVVRQLEANRRWIAWYARIESPVRAPIEALAQVIEVWNGLLKACERSLFNPRVKEAIELGAHFVADLSKYRKVMPVLAGDGS